MKKILFVLVFLSLFIKLIAQEPLLAPHYMTAEEYARRSEIGKGFQETPPPTGEVRNIAEWEPAEAVLIAYKNGFYVPYNLIAEMSKDCKVIITLSGITEENTARNLLTNNNVNIDNCIFLYTTVDFWWTRDYSPWYIAVDNKEVALIDFPYNRPRPNDDAIPSKMATLLDLDMYAMNVIQTGGNYMCDGYGIGASTDLVTEEETQTEAQILEKMKQYLGINQYFIMMDPMDDYIKHIDCWGKFIDVDKVIITKVPQDDYRYADYEATAAFFAETNCSWGYPYKVYRVNVANSYANDVNPYTNSLILNNKVFVPQTGSSFDADALEVYKQAMPGYEVYGIMNTNTLNEWYNTDALHCRTYGVSDRKMIFIKHLPVQDITNSQTDFKIEAEVYSFEQLSIKEVTLFYSVNGAEYQSINMQAASVKSNIYSAEIPNQPTDAEIKYYIKATDSNDKTVTNPLIGEADPHVFNDKIVNYIASENLESFFNIYPNPSSGNFFIWFDLSFSQNIIIEIFNIAGQNILTEEIYLTKDEHLKNIDISKYGKGVYLLKAHGKNLSITKKIFVN